MDNPFNIKERFCELEDYNFVLKIYRQTVFPYMKQTTKINLKLFKDNFLKNFKKITILMKGKRRIGFYMITKHKEHLFIDKLYLSRAYQKKGLGKYYMKQFEGLSDKIRLEVWKTNPAIKFYENLGYKKIKDQGFTYLMEKLN